MRLIRLLLVFTVNLLAVAAPASDDLPSREEAAMQRAVMRVTPSVVSIETVGGLERVGQVLFGNGPTTGLIVSSDGYIVSSAFNFAQKPTSILVELADGSRAAAQLVATDRNRMLVLLKVPAAGDLPVTECVAEDEMRVGQWSIAVGRAFDHAQPNMSVGIISALHRVWDKAIQTDAKISPANYGGPLVDIRGRVLGVLSPLSPMGSGDVQGVEWYDSGIGFAVPLEQILGLLPRLKQGHDLLPGLMGVNLQGRDQYAEAPVIAACRPNSPASKAGFKAGDRVVQVDEREIERQVQLLHEIHRRYAGDKLRVTVARGDERIERE
ncbi:MAG TPA: trypsin-like peptidase domain-containing protein, partial [Pirellulales bacterium]|nr:trypsin-like peptidase domain-containing protein [Pirellulales bacterium]